MYSLTGNTTSNIRGQTMQHWFDGLTPKHCANYKRDKSSVKWIQPSPQCLNPDSFHPSPLLKLRNKSLANIMRVLWTSLQCWVDFISIEHNGQLFCMHTNGPTLTGWNMRMGSGLFSKTLFPTRLELRCLDAGSFWELVHCSLFR